MVIYASRNNDNQGKFDLKAETSTMRYILNN